MRLAGTFRRLRWGAVVLTMAPMLALPAVGGSPAVAFEAVSRDGVCRFPARTCGKDGFVIVAPHAEQLVHWRWQTNHLQIGSRQARVFLDRAGAGQLFTLLLGSKDLASGAFDALIEEIVDRGGSVIVTRPTLDDADRLEEVAGLSGAAWDEDEAALLYGLRTATGDDGRTHESAFVLLADGASSTDRAWKYSPAWKLARASKLDQDQTEWLLDRIGPTPPVLQRTAAFPAADGNPTACDNDPQSCINKLAQAKHTSIKKSANGDSFEEDNFIYGARSFVNTQDYYYVEQQLQFAVCGKSLSRLSLLAGDSTNTPQIQVSSLLSPSPGSTQSTTTVTSGVSFSLGGQAGFSSSGPGFDVAPSLAFSNSKTTTVPPVHITNSSSPETGTTKWQFVDLDQVANYDLVFNTSWIWVVDLEDYTSDLEQFGFDSAATMKTFCNDDLPANLVSKVDQPFATPTIEAPMVNNLTPGSLPAGQSFNVGGSGFYPSLVEAVVLGGQTLDAGNWSAVSDTLVTVTAPANPPAFNEPLAVEIKTSKGASNTDLSVMITD